MPSLAVSFGGTVHVMCKCSDLERPAIQEMMMVNMSVFLLFMDTSSVPFLE